MPEPHELNQELTVVPKGRLAFEKFDLKQTAPFSERSVSEETRRAYRRVVREFFLCFKGRHPALITSRKILQWRDSLRRRKKKASTVAFKLLHQGG